MQIPPIIPAIIACKIDPSVDSNCCPITIGHVGEWLLESQPIPSLFFLTAFTFPCSEES